MKREREKQASDARTNESPDCVVQMRAEHSETKTQSAQTEEARNLVNRTGEGQSTVSASTIVPWETHARSAAVARLNITKTRSSPDVHKGYHSARVTKARTVIGFTAPLCRSKRFYRVMEEERPSNLFPTVTRPGRRGNQRRAEIDIRAGSRVCSSTQFDGVVDCSVFFARR